jgi:PAS domain S-box-containing protein
MTRSAWLDGAHDEPPHLLWEDGERSFCRVWRTGEAGTRYPCIAVFPTAEHPALGISSRLAREHALKEHIDGAWALRPLELVRKQGKTVLLLDYREGEPLDRLIGPPMEVAQFLRIATALAGAVAGLHKSGLIHKDIKPANILVDVATNRIWLTGFGVAIRLPRQRQAAEPPELIAGTLSHMAPEQTGRMNRSIDARSDLYSLGVTLYQALTGRLPFTATDAMEWVHCHVARRPAPPETPFLNDAFSGIAAIIMQLLAKTPEERYQTAAGVEHDLRRCLTDWEGRGVIEAFRLGDADNSARLLMSERLYGRENEIAALYAAFDNVVAGRSPALVLVSGSPGTGKSSVVNELHRRLVPSRGLFAAGKFDTLRRDIPYATLALAFQSLIRRLLSKPEVELGKWRDDLRHALEPNGALVTELVPELEFIVGEQPPVPEVPPSAVRARLHLTLRRMIRVFARPEHPLVLFFDDLQWLDEAMIDLLEDLIVQPDLPHLLLVGAYRDTDADAGAPLMRKLTVLHQAGAKVQTIALGPLSPEDLARCIADALRCEPQHAMPLAQMVHAKTAGNPFFVRQFLDVLTEEGLVAFDPGRAIWVWDHEAIQAKGYTENVVDLMVGKLRRLLPITQSSLMNLACLGNTVEAATLASASAVSEEDIHAHLGEAIHLDLIVHSDGSYRFVHDRIHEAAYSLIRKEERGQVHLAIGRRLHARLRDGQGEEAVFEVVGQLNRGASLITARDEREQVAELNLTAGKRAKAAAAYASALSYLTAGATLLGENGERCHGLLFALVLHRAECEFLTGAMVAAEGHLVGLLPRAVDSIERATVTCLLADVYIALQRLDRSTAVCLEYVHRVGLDIPMQPTAAQTRAAYEHVWAQLGKRSIEDLAELPLLTDPGSRATLDVLAKIARCALTALDMDLLSVILCAAVELSLERGNCDSSCYAYEYFGVIAGWRFGDFEAGFRFGRLGLELVERKGLGQFEALVCLTFAIRIFPWAAHVRGCRDLIRRAFDLGNRTGDRVSAVSSCCAVISNLLMVGEPLGDVEKEAEIGLAFCRRTGFRDFIDAADMHAALIRNLLGLTRRFGSFDDERFNESELQGYFESHPHARVFECWYWIRRLQARFFAGDFALALDASMRARALLTSSPALLEAAEYALYSALTHAAACNGVSADQRRQHLAAVAAHLHQLEEWARHCPENFENRATLVGAELARIEGREMDAMRLYERAMLSARENGFVHNEALACELAAHFYAARGFDKIARAYTTDARHGYLQWGAHGKVRQLDERYPYLRDVDLRPDSARTVQTPVEHLDLATVLKVLQAVSGETELKGLITTIMRLALEHAGAERGLLILPRGDSYWIEADAQSSDDGVRVILQQSPITAEDLPESVFQYVLRTKERVVLHDAGSGSTFSDAGYARRHAARSALCMPLLKQTRLVGVLYLENTLASGVFTSARMALLELVASEAAISLENARLNVELREREARVRRLVDSNIIGIVIWHVDGRVLDANEAFLRLVGYRREELVSGLVRWIDLTPPEWHERDAVTLAALPSVGAAHAHEREFIRKDGARVSVLAGGAVFDGSPDEGVAFVLDLTERKRAEDALRESERQARLIVDSIPGMVALLAATGGLEVVNQQLLEYFGQTLEELQAWGTNDTVHPEDRAEVIDVFTRAIASGRPYEIVQRFRRSDGVYRWFTNRGFPVPDANGKILRWCVLLTDIDERKRAEDALRNSERELRLVVDSIPGFVAAFTPGGEVDFANRQVLEYFGKRLEDMRHWGRNDTIHPDDLERVVGTVTRSLASGEPFEVELRALRFDGVYRWFQSRGSPLRDDSGQIIRWYNLLTDIEDRKRAEVELMRAHDSFADGQRLSRTGNFTADIVADNHIWSEECYRLFEFDPTTRISVEMVRDLIHPEDLPVFDGRFKESLEGAAFDLVFRIVTSSGAQKHVHAVGRLVERVAGRPLFIGALRDVTETRRAAEALDRARDELAHVARVTTLSTLTASIAHEVNQPLSGILTNASTCLRMLDVEPPNIVGARETAKRSIRDGKRAADIITRLRALFSKKDFALEPVDLNEVTREVIALSLSELQRNRVVLQSELDDDLPLTHGDRVQLQQVILNLFRNASDAMLDVHDRPRRLVVKTEGEDGNGLRLSVRDSGAGFDRQSLDHLFEAFYTTKRDGMGIGLSVSRSIIERHHGRLWAAQNDGPGATFSFSLPRIQMDEDGAASTMPKL